MVGMRVHRTEQDDRGALALYVLDLDALRQPRSISVD
jgi:hypothetical protein